MPKVTSAATAASSEAQRLLHLFRCSQRSFAHWDPATLVQNDRGKWVPRYTTLHRAVTVDDWQDHLDGKRALVLSLCCDDGTTQVTIVDGDDHSADISALLKKIKLSGLPLYLSLSKSGGPHIAAFHDAAIPVADSERLATEIGRRLGLGNYEVFPRPGFGVNLPYFGGQRGYLRLDGQGEVPVEELATTLVRMTADQRAGLLKTAPGDDGSGTGFANMMLERYCQQIATELPGGRNILINRAAWYLATMAARDWIGEDRIEDELMAAANAAGWDDDRKTLGTIRRALRAGLQEPHADINQHYAANVNAVMELNRDHALILVGDKAAVLSERHGGEFKLLAVSAFTQWLANRWVTIAGSKGDKPVPLAKHWLGHLQRRQYNDLVFAPDHEVPGAYNLWRGFAVRPVKGDCSKILAHIHDNVCQNDEALYRWFMAWWAAIAQRPAEKYGTSLVLRGKGGTGKTIVGVYMASIFGHHFVVAPEPRYVTGRFNSHLVSCLVLHADEGFWAGDKSTEGKLKDLITGNSQWIEYKGKEQFRVNNYVRLFVTGNPDWLVPASFEERRFATLQMGEDHREDHAYFAAIDHEMKNGGSAALLHHLLHEVDCSQVNLRQIPQTAALLEQKVASMTAEQVWWLDLLTRGVLPGDRDGNGEAPRKALYDHYIVHARNRGVTRRASETQLGMFLVEYAPPTTEYRPPSDKHGRRGGRVRVFEPLSQCRDHFARKLQTEGINAGLDWEDGQEWEADGFFDGAFGATGGDGPEF
jgi:hypothetical protein